MSAAVWNEPPKQELRRREARIRASPRETSVLISRQPRRAVAAVRAGTWEPRPTETG